MRFLTDSQTKASFVEMLRLLGHEVTTAFEQGLHGERHDWKLVDWARRFGYVFLTFDELRDLSGMEIAVEIKTNGGKVVCIHGGPDQDSERALGKLLFHWPDWYPKLVRHDGLIEIREPKREYEWYSRSRIHARVRPVHRPAFNDYLRQRAEAKKKPLKLSRRRRAHPQQAGFDVPSGAA